jgi:hypothetical protein
MHTGCGLWPCFGADLEKMDATVKRRPHAFSQAYQAKELGRVEQVSPPSFTKGWGDKRAKMTHKSRKK